MKNFLGWVGVIALFAFIAWFVAAVNAVNHGG